MNSNYKFFLYCLVLIKCSIEWYHFVVLSLQNPVKALVFLMWFFCLAITVFCHFWLFVICHKKVLIYNIYALLLSFVCVCHGSLIMLCHFLSKWDHVYTVFYTWRFFITFVNNFWLTMCSKYTLYYLLFAINFCINLPLIVRHIFSEICTKVLTQII